MQSKRPATLNFSDYAGNQYVIPSTTLSRCGHDRSGRYLVIPREMLAEARVGDDSEA
ncbi:MAG: hypothetical protein ACR2PL_26765 [Dehalococcoidia bacterium]